MVDRMGGERYEQLAGLVQALSAPIQEDGNPFHGLRAALQRQGLPGDLLDRIDHAAARHDKIVVTVSEEHLESDHRLLQMHQESARQWALVISRCILAQDTGSLAAYVRAASLGICPPGPLREIAPEPEPSATASPREPEKAAASPASDQALAARVAEIAAQIAATREAIDRIDTRVGRRRVWTSLAAAVLLLAGAGAGAFAAQRVEGLRARVEALDGALARLDASVARLRDALTSRAGEALPDDSR
jgi:hypothetical protein